MSSVVANVFASYGREEPIGLKHLFQRALMLPSVGTELEVGESLVPEDNLSVLWLILEEWVGCQSC